MRLEITVAAAGSRTGAAAISRAFGARGFAGLGDFAAINSPSEGMQARHNRQDAP
jgi:hypothetical protein